METLEIIRKAYTDACAELEKSQHRCSKLEALLRGIVETLPAEFACDTADLKALDKQSVNRLRKYATLAISAAWELANGNKTKL